MVRINELEAANEFMEEVQGEVRIGSSRIDASLGRISRQVLGFEKYVVMPIPCGSRCQKLVDERKMRFCLIWSECIIFS